MRGINQAEIDRAVFRYRKRAFEATCGMFADDSEFDEIVELAREYREQANLDDEGCTS